VQQLVERNSLSKRKAPELLQPSHSVRIMGSVYEVRHRRVQRFPLLRLIAHLLRFAAALSSVICNMSNNLQPNVTLDCGMSLASLLWSPLGDALICVSDVTSYSCSFRYLCLRVRRLTGTRADSSAVLTLIDTSLRA
jgi:hypothetical protein